MLEKGRKTMLLTKDFTKLAVGTKSQGREIQACPYCGKSGLLEEVYGKKFFTHSETVGVNDNNNPEIRWEMCPPQKKELPE